MNQPTTLKTSDFHYNLPKELIAQFPLEDRTSSRMLVFDRKTGEISHRHFYEITDFLNENDCLVLNDTKVIPARLIGKREKTEAQVELLLLRRKNGDVWETLAKPGKKALPGDRIIFGEGMLTAEILATDTGGTRIIKFCYDGIFEQILDMVGETPLPPYITEKSVEKSRYQTVYAAENGSAAAPTAGLHFTHELLQKCVAKGVLTAKITLHIGLGTFRPVKADLISNHEMHSEFFQVNEAAAAKIAQARKSGGRVIAVGTTATRTLESAAGSLNGVITPKNGMTGIFIYPPYKFKAVDALITNFHLPESTLIMLVSALIGRENTLAAYEEAVRERYRFFSFGDAMLIH